MPFEVWKIPTIYDDPDRYNSPFYYTGTGDSGGVHTNSGVANKLCYLLTDGGDFNKFSVVGMGIESQDPNDVTAPELLYECQTSLLTESSNYENLYYSLIQAASNLQVSNTQYGQHPKGLSCVEIAVPTSYGMVFLDRDQYAVDSQAAITLIDADLTGYGQTQVFLTGGSDYETVTLTEVDDGHLQRDDLSE